MIVESGICLVLGGANCLYDHLQKAKDLLSEAVVPVVACNESGIAWQGQLDHWCTLHPKKMPDWVEAKKKKPELIWWEETKTRFWTSNTVDLPKKIKWENVPRWNGSSGLLCVTVALHLGFKKIILCGVPLEKKDKHFFCEKPWLDAPRYRKGWLDHKKHMGNKVRSFSGWTKLLLGEPTKKWLESTE